tara:strand:+ start:53 stop:664 length:612 start_codon:yes stop_codon:yes gene_type:complete
MVTKMIIGIPIKSFNRSFTRLSNILAPSLRSELSKALLDNIISCLINLDCQIYTISNDIEVINFAKEKNIHNFSSKKNGLNNEVSEFVNNTYKGGPWCILHSDLPYINKFTSKQLIMDCNRNNYIGSQSKDGGTPLLGGKKIIDNFYYGHNSFRKHENEIQKNGERIFRIFSRELSFEIDTENDFKNFKKNLPAWYKKNKYNF